MQITDIRIRGIAKEGRMKAVVSITIDNEFVVHDIKVIEGDKGMFIAMPQPQSRGRRIQGYRPPHLFGDQRASSEYDPGEIPGGVREGSNAVTPIINRREDIPARFQEERSRDVLRQKATGKRSGKA